MTLQDVAGGGSVQFGGDVLASANAAVVLSAGTGSVPALVLAGSGNVQNIKAANGATLTLPALAISANTVNVGNAAGYNGSVVLSGATALTGASTPTLNVNAGSLQVSSTLASSVAGANVQVNSGGTLARRPRRRHPGPSDRQQRRRARCPMPARPRRRSSAAASRSMPAVFSSGRIAVPAPRARSPWAATP